MRVAAFLDGNLERFVQDELRKSEQAATGGMHKAGSRLTRDLRGDVVSGGLGSRLSKSWRMSKYPRKGASLKPAVVIRTRAKKLIQAFDQGVTIKSKNGYWLAIPTDSAPKRGLGRKRITPSNFPEHRLGKLRFVYRKNGPSMLVVDDQRTTKAGRYALSRSKRNLKTKRGLSTVPMFLMYPQVRLRKRLHVKSTIARGYQRIPSMIDAEFNRLDRMNVRK